MKDFIIGVFGKIRKKIKTSQKNIQSKLWDSMMKKVESCDIFINILWLIPSFIISLVIFALNILLTKQFEKTIPPEVNFAIISAVLYCFILLFKFVKSLDFLQNLFKFLPNAYIICYYLFSFLFQYIKFTDDTQTYDDTIKMFTLFFVLVNIIERIGKTITNK